MFLWVSHAFHPGILVFLYAYTHQHKMTKFGVFDPEQPNLAWQHEEEGNV